MCTCSAFYLMSFGLCCSCLGRHVESVALFMASSQLTDFHDLCLLGLALYKSNRLTDSYQGWFSALALHLDAVDFCMLLI